MNKEKAQVSVKLQNKKYWLAEGKDMITISYKVSDKV